MTGIYMREHHLAVCKNCFPKWFEGRVAETIERYKMFKKDERILLGVSGGKDSLALWQVLIRLGYQADGLYLSLGIKNDNYSLDSKEKCIKMKEKLGRELYIVDLKNEIEISIDDARSIHLKTCSICGTVKRYFLNKITREKAYPVIATGHNLDDEAATLFGNLLRWEESYLRRQYPVISGTNFFARKVKPLAFMYERQCAIYALTSGIDYIRTECPYSSKATSISYKENLNQLENRHEGIMKFFYTNFTNAKKKDNAMMKAEEVEIVSCQICGEPTTVAVCRFCRIKEKIMNKKKNETEKREK